MNVLRLVSVEKTEVTGNIFLVPRHILKIKECHAIVCLPKSVCKLEDLKRSPDLLNNVKIGQGQLRLIILTYFVLPYMGSGHYDQVT